MSEKFLAQQTRCSPEECLEVLQKVGKPWRLDASKWELSDRGYKDLDLWKFPYPSQDDRQMAIENATKAFDRMRLSRADGLWQLLLPKEERGKGKVLSRLNLHEGPIQKSSTPRIHVQQPEEATGGGYGTGTESDGRRGGLLPSGGEDMARSKSHEPIKKTKVSEREAQSKRLLSKNPKRTTQAAKPKETKPKETKPAQKKETTTSGNKVKSAEFVHDSDEESGMEDIIFTSKSNGDMAKAEPRRETNSSRKSSGGSDERLGRTEPSSEPPSSVRSNVTKAIEPRVLPSTSASSRSSHRYSDASQSSASDQSLKKAPARPRTTSSPHKPSPLGSSPPTNASEIENDGHSYMASSASSSPLILQTRKDKTTPSTAHINQTTSTTPRQSSHALKRKADSIETDLPGSSSQTSHSQSGSIKRHQSSVISPPTSDSSASPPPTHQIILTAKRFKSYHSQYEKLYREVSNSPEPDQEQVKKVLEMHNRLATLKMEIARAASVS